MPELTVEASKDAFLSGVSKTMNFGANDYTLCRIQYAGSLKVAWERAIGNFDVSQLAGATIISAKLIRHIRWVVSGGGHAAIISRCTRPADWVESQVTWNQYRNGSAWTNPGGDFDDVTPGKITYIEPSVTGDHEIFGLKPYVEDALEHRGGIVSLLIRLADEAPQEDQDASWNSREHGSDIWRLVIEYQLPADPGRRSTPRQPTGRGLPRPAGGAPAARPARPSRPASRARPRTPFVRRLR